MKGMRWFGLFIKENMIRSFRFWEKTAAVFALLIAVFAAIFTFIIRSQMPGLNEEQYIGIGLVVWFLLLVLVVTPARMAVEKVKLTTKRLRVVRVENYDPGKGPSWLRLVIENPTGVPIKECYGKLCERKMIATNLTRIDDKLVRLPISPEEGGKSLENMELPPEGQKFPWSPESGGDRVITISGFNSREYLYFAAKLKNSGAFGFPSYSGVNWTNFALGDFEIEIEVGSESEDFKPTKVGIVLRAEGGDLEIVSWKESDVGYDPLLPRTCSTY